MASERETFTLLDMIHDAIVLGQHVGHQRSASQLVNVVLAGAKRHGYLVDLSLTLAEQGSPIIRPEQEAEMRALEDAAKRDWSPTDTGAEPC